jgi:hypothetical protein
VQGTSGVTVEPLTVAPSQPAGLGVRARPTLAPATWSPSSALTTNRVFFGVIPSAASRLKNVPNASL